MINTIIHGDCIEIMKAVPAKSIHLIITDPPYGLSYNQNDLAAQWESVFGGKIDRQKPNGIMSDGEEEANELFRAFLNEAKRILVKGGCCCCCCGGGGPKPLFAKWTLWMDEVIGFKQAVVWDKGGLGMGIHYRRNYEFMLIAQNGVPAHAWNGGNDTPNIISVSKIIPSAEQHPTQKPVTLFAEFIKIHSNEGDTVLDPFCGSGTAAEAAYKLKRNYICIEKDKRFYEMAELRMKNIKSQMQLF